MKQIKHLYHYSKDKYDILKTRAMQGLDAPRNYYVRDDYNLTMSFFLEPAPLDILGSIYKDGCNDFWFTGNQVWEYVVDIDTLNIDGWYVVESLEVISFMNKWWYEDCKADDTFEEYKKRKVELETRLHLAGVDKDEFIKTASKYVGHTRDCYMKLPHQPSWDDPTDNNKAKYAACVPHVMLKPTGGVVEYVSVQRATVGAKKVPGLESMLVRKSSQW